MPLKTFIDKTPFPPKFIRRVFDDVANEGLSITEVALATGLPKTTITNWVRFSGLKRGEPMSESELDSWSVKTSHRGIARMDLDPDELERRMSEKPYRRLSARQQDYADNGYMDMKGIPSAVEEVTAATAFTGILASVDRQITLLERSSEGAENLQQLTSYLTAAIGLKQLRELYLTPPPIMNWKDAKIVVDVTRDALDMNRKQVAERKAPLGVNVNILGISPNKVTVTKEVEIDVDSINEELRD